jgi:2-polyprenyl-6-methoxyphenol hydroxylase-like FAD-dependent oxidoreductase
LAAEPDGEVVTAMRNTRRVLVVGAGIGGLAAAVAFGQRGVEVDVVEIRPEGSVRGVGLTLSANALRALDKIRLLEESVSAGYQYDRRRFFDPDGNLIVECPSRLGGDGVPSYNGIRRAELLHIIAAAAVRAGATIRCGATVSDLTQQPDRVDVGFTDGRSGSYDLVLGFDGINSQLRRRLFGDTHEPRYTGCGAWRMLLPRPDEVVGLAIYQGPTARVGVVPADDSWMYLFCTTRQPAGQRHDPDRYDDLLRQRLMGYTGLVGEIRNSLRNPAGITYNPLSEVLVPPPWWRGRVVILGDAAHACTPQLGQGAAMALEDAVLLAELLPGAASTNQALTDFMQRRHHRVRLVQDVSRSILNAELRTTADNIAEAFARMRSHLPSQLAHVEGILNQPA